MNKGQQDKLWNELSEETRKEIQRDWQTIQKAKAIDDLSVYGVGRHDVYEELFGSHNLKPEPLTYADVAKELFKDGAYSPVRDTTIFEFKNKPVEAFVLNCTTPKQAKKLLAINKLLNVAKYLNGDWKPDWKQSHQEKYYIFIDKDGDMHTDYEVDDNCQSIVYFRTEELAKQAVAILGEETIRLALSNDY